MERLLPEKLLESLTPLAGYDEEAFVRAHEPGEPVTSIRINPAKCEIGELFAGLGARQQVPWCPLGYYLPQRPSFTFDPLFHAGCYYVQEASSMFLDQVLRQEINPHKPLRVLDLCAAPGGKSTHILSRLPTGSLLVSNEVIRSRVPILRENLVRWGRPQVVVTSNDPRDFAGLEGYFDLMLVDAPCSGSGLFRKDPDAREAWSESLVTLCAQRQQRILADAWPCLKQGGLLVYATCSYSEQEDEAILRWIRGQFAGESVDLLTDPSWGIALSAEPGATGYRFWPHRLRGEGLFLTAFRKSEGKDSFRSPVRNQVKPISSGQRAQLDPWVQPSGWTYFQQPDGLFAIPQDLVADLPVLLASLRVLQPGIQVGNLLHDKFVPDHALALSPLVPEGLGIWNLSREDAVRYLQKKEWTGPLPPRGLHRVAYRDHPLGWINSLGSRVNNYYPKSLRIRKERSEEPV
ncbi:MAG TPA: hypothetical protein VG870_05920 [Chitinophagaceae bacterium]|nr:hypothetical protein [Chitinophagaceae bacterium]